MARKITREEAASVLGRLGGLKGGKARMEKLSPEERRELGKKAAAARWKKHRAKKAEEESAEQARNLSMFERISWGK